MHPAACVPAYRFRDAIAMSMLTTLLSFYAVPCAIRAFSLCTSSYPGSIFSPLFAGLMLEPVTTPDEEVQYSFIILSRDDPNRGSPCVNAAPIPNHTGPCTVT